MGMKPEPQYKNQNLDMSIQGFVNNIISEAKNSFAGVISAVDASKKSKVGEDVLEINRVMIRQLMQREDIKAMLALNAKSWKASKQNTAIVAVINILIFVFAVKSIPLFLVFFLCSVFSFLILNLFAEQNLPKNIHKLLRKIAGSDEHLYVLEDMIKNTPYTTKSTIESGWVLRELLNFQAKDREFLLKDNTGDGGNSMKTDLLRNINNE